MNSLTISIIAAILSFLLALYMGRDVTKKAGVAARLFFILCLIFAVLDTCKKDPEKGNKEIIDNAKSESQKILSAIDAKNDPGENVTKGFSFYMVLSPNNMLPKGRKYILDYGESEDRNRLSVYFDADNNIIYRLINEIGEIQTCKISYGQYTIQPQELFFIYCSCGVSENFSFMRIKINDSPLWGTHSPFREKYIDESFFDGANKKPFGKYDNGAIGADINGDNSANFALVEWVFFNSPLNNEKINYLYNNIVTRLTIPSQQTPDAKAVAPLNSWYRIDKDGHPVMVEGKKQ